MNKLCIVSSTVPPARDGVGDSTQKLNRLFRSKGYESYILTSINLPSDNYVFNIIKNWSFYEVIKSLFYLKKIGIDLIIFQYPTLFYKRRIFITFLPLFSRAFGFKVISYLHEFSNYSILGKCRIIPLLLFSNKIITTDTINNNELSKLFFIRTKVHLIPSGSNVPENILTRSKKKPDSNNGKIKLLFFGLIRSGKGLETLVDLFENEISIRARFELNVVGEEPQIANEESKKLMECIKKSEHIIFQGFLNDDQLGIIFKKSDLIVLPFSEGVTERRGSFMTAAAMGKAIVTTKPKFKIEGLIDWENVIFIDDNSVESLINFMNMINVTDKNKLKILGENAKDWYFGNYSEDKMISQFINVIKKLS